MKQHRCYLLSPGTYLLTKVHTNQISNTLYSSTNLIELTSSPSLACLKYTEPLSPMSTQSQLMQLSYDYLSFRATNGKYEPLGSTNCNSELFGLTSRDNCRQCKEGTTISSFGYFSFDYHIHFNFYKTVKSQFRIFKNTK